MPGVKISNLQDGAALQNTDSFPVARGGATRRIEGSRLLTPETFQIQSTPTIGLNWNSNTKTLQASATSAVTSFNTVNSPTINLNWNSSTRTLSADASYLLTLINQLSTNMQTVGTKPMAQVFGSGGAHTLGTVYDPQSLNWISIAGGQIWLNSAGIYHFQIFYGGNATGGCYNYTSSMQPILRRISDSVTLLSGPVLGSRDSNFSGDGGSFSGLITTTTTNVSVGIYLILAGVCSSYLGGTSAIVTKIT